MIVPSMTLDEIHKELFSDLRTLESKIESCRKDFKRKVLGASRYPYTFTYNFRTLVKRNLFLVMLYAPKRSDWEKPMIGICAIYERPEGIYAAALALERNMTTVFPPHFFKRYRERIAPDLKLSNVDLIKQYFKRNGWGFVAAPLDQKYLGLYNFFESDLSNEPLSFVSVSSEGFYFGEKHGKINVVKTIISEDMLRGDQKEIFANLKEDFYLYNKEMFGPKFSG